MARRPSSRRSPEPDPRTPVALTSRRELRQARQASRGRVVLAATVTVMIVLTIGAWAAVVRNWVVERRASDGTTHTTQDQGLGLTSTDELLHPPRGDRSADTAVAPHPTTTTTGTPTASATATASPTTSTVSASSSSSTSKAAAGTSPAGPSPAGPSAGGPAKPYLSGLMSRAIPPKDSLTYDGRPLLTGFVIPINWNEVQPSGPGDFVTADIDAKVAFAREHGLGVRFRIYAGYQSPAWVMAQVGSMPWKGTGTDGGPASYTVPHFWTSEFRSLYQAFDRKLAARYDAVPEVREVVEGMCITNFAEPFIRQFSVAENVATATAHGYTDAANNACLRGTMDVFRADWPTSNFAMPYNPYQSVTERSRTGGQGLTAEEAVVEPRAIAGYCLSTLGKRCLVGNNSLAGSSRGPGYDVLYAMLADLHMPMYIQTANDGVIGDWQACLSTAVGLGAQTVELPPSFMSWDLAALQSFNARLATNAARF